MSSIPLVMTAEGMALKAVGSTSSSSITANGSALTTRSGYISKWTNLARGYRTRWFVLENGKAVLSINMRIPH
jgi:hypothetical protein